MTGTSILTSKGQTTVPKEVRDFLGLDVGDRIVYVIEAGEVKMQAARQQVDELFGAFDAFDALRFDTAESPDSPSPTGDSS